MKKPLNYKPKFSLSLSYLRDILTKEELNRIIDLYVEAKIARWKKNIRQTG